MLGCHFLKGGINPYLKKGIWACCFGTHIRDCLLIFTGYSPHDGKEEYIPTLLNREEQMGSHIILGGRV